MSVLMKDFRACLPRAMKVKGKSNAPRLREDLVAICRYSLKKYRAMSKKEPRACGKRESMVTVCRGKELDIHIPIYFIFSPHPLKNSMN